MRRRLFGILSRRSVAAGAALGIGLTAAMSVSAHHSAAMFDFDQELKLSGTVARFDYVNPHSWLYVNIENEDGSTTEWGLELDAPPRLRRLGVSPRFWEPGDRVTVKVNPLKDGRPAGHLAGATNDDGEPFGNTAGL